MMAQPLVKHIQAQNPRQASGQLRLVYRQMTRENAGIHGPFLIHASRPELLTALWALFRETQLAGDAPRAHMETLALLIAEENRCPWCIEAHQVAMHTQSRAPEVVAWYAAQPNPLQSAADVTFGELQHITYRAGVLLWQYVNRMTNALLVESAWQNFGALRQPLRGALGVVFGKFIMNRQYPPGRSLSFLSPAVLPEHLNWAAAHPTISPALAAFHHEIELGAQALIPYEVQHLVRQVATQQQGQRPAMSRRWVDYAVQPLTESQRPLARVLLLMALAAYQLDKTLIQELQRSLRSDADLIAILAWGSYAPFNPAS